ncbi:HIRAN domain-containing protein [Streptomyces sp. NPDC000410]|uniref:HIRAN domain-containing protein n=1 Tax=Streptomyces sp. NPDC000410 TaxID=3154254 RepID=UPI00332E0C32
MHGSRHARSTLCITTLAPGTPVDLIRDPGNRADPNAVRVEHEGHLLGWVAGETARPLASALDDTAPTTIAAQLSTTSSGADADLDAQLTLTLTSA